jgi:hypothetical protein
VAKIYYVDLSLNYKFSTPYNDTIWKGEWVRGFAVQFSITVNNRSEFYSPGAYIRASVTEHHSSSKAGTAHTWPRFLVPRLKPDTQFTSPEYEYTPLFEGACEVMLDSDMFKRREINISGSMQRTAIPTRISSRFFVVRWQELEIIQLLRKLVAKEA